MKRIWNYLRNHIQEDFNAGHYITIFLFLTICITVNYSTDFKRTYVNTQVGLLKVFSFMLLYAFAYFFSIISYSIFYKKTDFFKKKNFWLYSLFILFIIALDGSLPYVRDLFRAIAPQQLEYWLYKIIYNISSLFTVIIPLSIFYYLKDRKSKHFYGLQIKSFNFRPYLLMLTIMLPVIALASFHQSFLRQYPMCPSTDAHFYFNVSPWIPSIVYELTYGFDFISVELLFRGFLVIGMMHFLGRSSVLIMAVIYCFLHFCKPAGEAMSSIFGGYILGVIAYETKSIWGGIILHMGIAWSMEAAAFMQKL